MHASFYSRKNQENVEKYHPAHPGNRAARGNPDADGSLRSVPQGPGAYDNMAGAAIIMELAHYFAENRPKRTLECIWFGAEELGLCGSRAM